MRDSFLVVGAPLQNTRTRNILQQLSVTLAIVPAGIFLASCSGGRGAASSSLNPSSATRSISTADSVIVQASSPSDVRAVVRDLNSVVLDSDPEDGVYSLSVPSGQNADSFAARLAGDTRISSAEPNDPINTPEGATSPVDGDPVHLAFDLISTVDTDYRTVTASGTGVSTGVNADAYRQIDLGTVPSLTKGAGITVAVLDTGVLSTHPSLLGNIVPGYNTVVPNAPAEDIADGTTNIVWGHGTMVAGVIVRLAPAVKILPVRVLNGDGIGSIIGVVRGIRFAVKQGAQVINLSLDTPRFSPSLAQAVRKATLAGVVVVAAAGNQGTDGIHYPAAFDGVLGVGAVDATDRKAIFSNYGSSVAITAPGTGIRSTYINGGYASWSGTSFAAPFVSAAAALTLSAQPGLTGRAATQLLATTRSLDTVNPSYCGRLGRGMLDVQRAVTEKVTNGSGNNGQPARN